MPTEAAKTLSPAEEAQKEDEKILSENKQDIEEVLKFIEEMKDLDSSSKKIDDLRMRADQSMKGKKVFHDRGGKSKIPLAEKTSHLIKLADELEENMRLSKHGQDLHAKLKRLVKRRIQVLERVKQRGLF